MYGFLSVWHCTYNCILYQCSSCSTLKNITTLKISRLWVTHPANLFTFCALLKSTDLGLCFFAADSVGLSYLFVHIKSGNSCMMCYGRPRSFKVIEICTNREPLWDFLLISVQNMCLSSIVSEIKRFIGQKSAFLHHFTHPSVVWSPHEYSHVLLYEIWPQESRLHWRPEGKTAWSYCHYFWLSS